MTRATINQAGLLVLKIYCWFLIVYAVTENQGVFVEVLYVFHRLLHLLHPGWPIKYTET